MFINSYDAFVFCMINACVFTIHDVIILFSFVIFTLYLILHNYICYYIMVLSKQFDWLSCCHLKFRKIWYCLIKTCIDPLHFHFPLHYVWRHNEEINFILTWFHFQFSFYCNKTITVFCIGQYKFLWTLKTIFTSAKGFGGYRF